MDKLLTDCSACLLNIACRILIYSGKVNISYELAVLIVMSRWKRSYLLDHSNEVLCLTGKNNVASPVVAVEQRSYANRISCRNQAVCLKIVDNESEFRAKHWKHVCTILVIKRKKNLTVAFTCELVCLCKLLPYWSEAVNLAVAYKHISIKRERLHALISKTHDCKSVKTQPSRWSLNQSCIIRTSRYRLLKERHDFLRT